MSLERPLPRVRSWGFSLCGLCAGIDALSAQIGVQIGPVIANAPPNSNKGWPGVSVPPLRKLFGGPENAEFRVFREKDAVVIVDVSHR